MSQKCLHWEFASLNRSTFRIHGFTVGRDAVKPNLASPESPFDTNSLPLPLPLSTPRWPQHLSEPRHLLNGFLYETLPVSLGKSEELFQQRQSRAGL